MSAPRALASPLWASSSRDCLFDSHAPLQVSFTSGSHTGSWSSALRRLRSAGGSVPIVARAPFLRGSRARHRSAFLRGRPRCRGAPILPLTPSQRIVGGLVELPHAAAVEPLVADLKRSAG